MHCPQKHNRFIKTLRQMVGVIAGVGLASQAHATSTPQLTAGFGNVWSLAGTNYYGSVWTNPATSFFHGSGPTNIMTTKDGVSTVTYSSSGVRLMSSSYGQPVETDITQFNLGDPIPWPEGADSNRPPANFVPVREGNNTSAYYTSTNPVGAVFYIPSTKQVIAGAGGQAVISWHLTAGGTLTVPYTIAFSPSVRPSRVFWTEDPYNAPVISLKVGDQPVFAAIHYNGTVTRPILQTVTNVGDTGSDEVSTQLVSGVWIKDLGSGQTELRATGIEGMALIEYFRDGTFMESMGCHVFQVLPPDEQLQTIDIGSRILPRDLYYGVDDLDPSFKAGGGTDGTALQYTQDGPKKNWVFAIRTGEAHETIIYWEHADLRGVKWPFEMAWYEIQWPRDPQKIAFDPTPASENAAVVVPTGLQVDLVFQSPDQVAQLSGNGAGIMPLAEGNVLIQYQTTSNIWFEPVYCVGRNETNEFDLTAVPWVIGTELVPHGGTEYPLSEYTLGFDGGDDYVSAVAGDEHAQGGGYTIEAWIHPDQITGTRVIAARENSNNEGYSFFCASATGLSIRVALAGTNVTLVATNAALPLDIWTHVAATYLSGSLKLHVNGETVAATAVGGAIKPATNAFWIGSSPVHHDQGFCGSIGEVRLWSRALSDPEIQAGMNMTLSGTESGLVACFAFREGAGSQTEIIGQAGEMAQIHGANWWRKGHDLSTYVNHVGYIYRKSGTAYNPEWYRYPTAEQPDVDSHIFAVNTNDLLEVWWANPSLQDLPFNVYYPSLVQNYRNVWPTNASELVIASSLGSKTPQVDKSVFTFPIGVSPTVYVQNDPAQDGFNPNEEHALVVDDVVYALRCDLNDVSSANSSAPYVMACYSVSDGVGTCPAMKVFHVVATNADFSFTGTATAGQLLQPPMPLPILSGGSDASTTCLSGPGWRDRKLSWWAKSAGNDGGVTNIVMHYWYRLQNGFFFPERSLATQPAEGTLVPWLSGGLNGVPVDYGFEVSWPADTPFIQLAQTLYKAPGNSGLPDLYNQLSVDVLYQQSTALGHGKSVELIDPTVMRGTSIDRSVVEQMAAAGKATRASPGVTYEFVGVPPSLEGRLIYDPDQPVDRQLYVKGQYVDTLTDGYLLLNLIASHESSNVLHLADGAASSVVTAWRSAVGRLPQMPLIITNQAFDTAALSAGIAQGTGFVTVAFNNSTNTTVVPEGLPVTMSVLRVVPELYNGPVAVIAPASPLDEKLTLQDEADFGGQAAQYYFEWRTLPPTVEGLPPTNVPPAQWQYYDAGTNKPGITIQGAGVFCIVDNYFLCRYRPAVTNLAVGTNVWSEWQLGFAPGWIQRVLNGITPFEQRNHDMAEYAPNTGITMIQQAGPPYSGPVTMNMDAIDDYGLIQIYQSVLDRGKMLSIDAGIDYAPANSSLMLAAGRLSDLYMLLGNEAFADAQDPTIGFGTGDIQFGQEATSIFCFENQVASLLDEELSLLRGRDNSLQPSTTTAPFYNRLAWNYTRGLNGGEVAYAYNYGVPGAAGTVNSTITPADAKALYPQGHGDAWGHYLSAMAGYYQLLHHPDFEWEPGIGAMVLGGSGDLVLSVDYYDEQKFADAAAAKSRAGLQVMDRTYRKFFAEEAGGQWQGYRDEDSTRAWGVSEWASRVGQGALIDWAVANSLLPDAAPPEDRNWCLAFTNNELPVCYATMGQHTLSGPEITVEMWVQSVASNREAALFGGWMEGTASDGSRIALTNLFSINTNGCLSWYLPLENQTMISTTRVDDGAWHHVAWVYENPTNDMPLRSLYVDGVQEVVQSNVLLVVWNNWYWTLGAQQDGPGGTVRLPFDGNIDEVRVWTVARDASAIASQMYRCLAGNETGLMAYYPMLDGSGEILHDRVGNSLGTIYASAWITPTSAPPASLQLPPAPTESANGATFAGILKIDRASVPSLASLAANGMAVQRQLDNADAGLSPIGLAPGTVPFDIDPAEMADGKTHFEQIYERAVTALNNAVATFNVAKGANQRLRQQFASHSDWQEDYEASERDYRNRLIEVFGYPYSDDIGPGRTYPQGYVGPDLINYQIVEPASFAGLPTNGQHSVTVTFTNLVFSGSKVNEYEMTKTAWGTTTVELTEDGAKVKPTGWTGHRQAEGEIQRAMVDYIRTWYEFEKSRAEYGERMAELQFGFEHMEATAGRLDKEWDLVNDITQEKIGVASSKFSLEQVVQLAEICSQSAKAFTKGVSVGLPKVIATVFGGIELEVPKSAAEVSAEVISYNAKMAIHALNLGVGIAELTGEIGEYNFERTIETNRLGAEIKWGAKEVEDSFCKQYSVAYDLLAKMTELSAAQQRIKTLLAEGERLLEEREMARARGARQIQSLRYADMTFRIMRDDALQKYAATFDVAARYCYLAAKAYDYETGLLDGDTEGTAGSRFLADIVRARSLGVLSGYLPEAVPMVGGVIGDPGLSDCMARMKADWDVAKGRLGVNSPDVENSRFSLRTELMRILPDAAGDQAWRTALASARVENLYDIPEFRRHCIPFSSTTNREPALVIEFPSMIMSRFNFFGNKLAGGDNAFDPSRFATKIRSVGVWFTGYNNTFNTNSYGAGLANQPYVYLIPVGNDLQRSPTDGGGAARKWSVVDQALPLPYNIGQSQLDNPDWIPLMDGLSGPLAVVRKHAALRAYHDSGSFSSDEICTNTRLVGRSVWNDRWLLIIPGSSLHSNPDTGLDRFIYGSRDTTGVPGITDIKLLLRTYSNAGN